jgi:hypothetical protein
MPAKPTPANTGLKKRINEMETQLQYQVDSYRFLDRTVKKTKIMSALQAFLDNQETP